MSRSVTGRPFPLTTLPRKSTRAVGKQLFPQLRPPRTRGGGDEGPRAPPPVQAELPERALCCRGSPSSCREFCPDLHAPRTAALAPGRFKGLIRTLPRPAANLPGSRVGSRPPAPGSLPCVRRCPLGGMGEESTRRAGLSTALRQNRNQGNRGKAGRGLALAPREGPALGRSCGLPLHLASPGAGAKARSGGRAPGPGGARPAPGAAARSCPPDASPQIIFIDFPARRAISATSAQEFSPPIIPQANLSG